MIHEDGIEVVVEVLCGVFGDDNLRRGDVLGDLDGGRHVAAVIGGATMPILAAVIFCV